MHLSPPSDPADGVLELLAFTGPKTDSFTMLPRFWPSPAPPRIFEAAGRRFRLDSENPFDWRRTARCWASAVTIEVVPGALDLKR